MALTWDTVVPGPCEWETSCPDHEVQHLTAEGAGASAGQPTSGPAKVPVYCNSARNHHKAYHLADYVEAHNVILSSSRCHVTSACFAVDARCTLLL